MAVAMKPAIIAVAMPEAADMPDVIPNPIARGRATIETVRPAMKSAIHSLRVAGKSLRDSRAMYRRDS